MRAALAFGAGLAVGAVLAMKLRQPSSARCCEQLSQLVRDDVRKRCGDAASICERVGGALGLFDHASALLDLAGVTT